MEIFCNNTIQKFAIQWVSIFFKEINTFIQQGCVKMMLKIQLWLTEYIF